MLLGFGALAQFPNNPCAGPSQRVALVNLQKGAVVEGWRAGQIGLTDTCGNQFYQQYVEVNLTPIGYTPTATGNTANLSEFVITPAAEIWYIDWQGNAINLSGGGGCDEDFLQISDNSCPDALTDSIYKYKYVSIGARGVWPVAELLVSDSVGVGMAVISGNRNGRVAIHDNLNDNWSVYDQGGSTTNIYVQDQGLFRVATATGSPQNAALLEEHFGVSTLDSTIIFYQYPNSRVDTQTAINFLYTDNLGIVRSKLLSQILGDSATVYNLSTINPLPTQYQKSTSFVRKNLNTATPIPQRGMWISNGSEWLWLGFVLDTNQVVTPFIANQNVTYPKIQNVTASRLLGNPTGAGGTVQEIKIGTNLYFSNDTLHANAGGAGQVLTAGDGSGDNKTLDLSGGGGTVTLDPSGIFTLSRTGNTLTMSAVEVDGSVTNELQTIGVASNTTTLSNGGGSMTIAGAGINTVATAGTTITVTGTEVDGSVTNEGVLGVGAGGGNDALLLSNTSGATGTTIAGGTGIQITETTSANGGTITITNAAAAAQVLTAGDGSGDNKTLDLSGGGGTVTLDPSGIFTLSRTGNTLTMSAVEVDGSVTNEGVLGVGAGGGNDALLLSNTSGATGTTIAGGTGIQITETTSANGGTITITNAAAAAQVLTAGDGTGDNKTLDLSGGGGTVTLDPSGILTLSRTGNTLTMSAVEVDGSVTNELQTIGVASNTTTLSNGGGSMTIAGAGINTVATAGTTITVTGTEVDGSVTNEGVLGVGAGGGNDALLLSNTSGATGTTISGGTGIQITETTSANGGTITITNTAADRDWLTITNLFPTVFDSFIYRRKPVSIGTNIFRKASDLKHTPFQVVDSTGYLGANAGVLALFSGNRRGGVAFQDNNEPDGSAFSRITQRGQICQLSFVEGGSFELMSDDGTTLDEGTQTTRFTYYTADDEGGTAYWPDYGGSRSDTAQLFTVSGFGFGGKMVSKPASAVVGSSAFINGGNSFGTTTTLGTNDAQALNIETNGTTRATFTTDYALKLVEATAVPATPSNGVIFSNSEIAGKNIPFWMDPNGVPYEIAAARETNRYYEWSAVPGSGTPSIWATTSSPYGTSSIPTLSASLIGQIVRISYLTSATASSNAGTRNTSSTYLRGNAAGVGGFYYVGRWGFSTANTTDKRFFAGFRSSATQIPASTNPSSMTQIIGFGIDGGQTTLRFMVNDNTGTATTVDLGANFPTNTNGTDYYEARIFCPENGSTVYYHIKNIATGNVAFGSANTDLPNNTTLLSVHHHISNGADAVSVALDLSQFTIITKY